ncbi:hypothetical protein C8J56DRAFT_819508 [Mycena floridula]|nr:hypothetical protein C8J56DRAFT_819508 [Mycena floridula]
MSSFFNKLKSKATHRKSASQGSKETEPTFSIQPHPAKTNDPADLQPTQPGGGLRSDPVMGAHQAKGPFIPNAEMMNNIEQPISHEEATARALDLNR